MAKSIKQIEQDVLVLLTTLGEDFDKFVEAKTLPGFEALVADSVQAFIERVQENLKNAGKIDTGTLASQITAGELKNNNGTYEITVGYPEGSEAAKYYDFVNKGVQGFDSKKPADSPYKFQKKLNKKGGIAISLGMQLAIAKWYRRNAGFARKDTQQDNLSKVQSKRKKVAKMATEAKRLKSLAYATSVNIKRKGIKKTGFFDKAVKASFGNDFTRLVSMIAGKVIAVNIKPDGNNNR